MERLTGDIPEFYYDLITRVTPGALLCGALAWHHRDALPLPQWNAAVLLPVGLLASYWSGLLLDVASSATLGRLAGVVASSLGRQSTVWRADLWRVIDHSPSDRRRARLQKMMAERALLRSTVSALLLLRLLGAQPVETLPPAAFVVVLLAAVALWWQWEYQVRVAARVDS